MGSAFWLVQLGEFSNKIWSETVDTLTSSSLSNGDNYGHNIKEKCLMSLINQKKGLNFQ